MLSDVLRNKKCFKLVCGAGNEDVAEIEKLVYVYSKAGCNLFDLSANLEVIKAAKSGLKKAGINTDRYLCVSVGIKGDPHINKAIIDQNSCQKCDACKKICPQNAIFEDALSYNIKKEKCIGCAKCTAVCRYGSITLESVEIDLKEVIPPIIEEGIDCIEFHAITENDGEVYKKWQMLSEMFNGIMSICIDRTKLSDSKLIERISNMTKGRSEYNTIIQADGAPMSGGKDDYKSTLQAVATAEIVQKINLPVYILLSGGTNSKSSELASLCCINISGVAIGTYARQIVREYISAENFWDDSSVQNKAIDSATKLVNAIFKWL